MPTATGEVEQPVRREVALSRPFSTLSGLEILCIDNDPRILEGMRLLLEGWGCEVAAWSGMRAFLEARERRSAPDIVLADYHLDGENGLDAIDRLRQIYGADTPAVLVTADRSTEVRAAAEARGVSVINKPVRPAVLRTLLSRVRPLAAE
jgi:CheY-like chemotaxis protein